MERDYLKHCIVDRPELRQPLAAAASRVSIVYRADLFFYVSAHCLLPFAVHMCERIIWLPFIL